MALAPGPPRLFPVDRVLAEGRRVRVGMFRCHPSHPRFDREGEILAYDFVFPRTAVWIRHGRGRPFVADPATVTLYNHGQDYRRRALDPRGDHADWFSVDQEMAVEAASLFERVPPSAERPWRFSHLPAEPSVYLQQRVLVERLRRGEPMDNLELEERVGDLLASVLALGHRAEPRPAARSQQRLATRARALLAERFRDPLGLGDMASALGCSPFHLSRVFRRATGVTLHAWRNRLRLNAALETIVRSSPERDITGVALDAGFSSHSHFTAAFRAAFGQVPSAFRRVTAGAPSESPTGRHPGSAVVQSLDLLHQESREVRQLVV